MRYRKLTATGDYSFGNGQLDFWINSPEGVAQAIKTGLLLWLGEWYLDNSLGMPWIQGVLGKHSQAMADSIVQNYIQNNIQGVQDIIEFESVTDPYTREYSVIKCVVNTIYGPTQVQIANLTTL